MGEKMMLATELRRVCGHDSRSVDVCLHCEAADALDAVHLANSAQTVDIEAVRVVSKQLKCTDETGLNAESCYQLGDKLSQAIGDKT